jgi:crotonobetainyl-CoA:carnitine CoA-transferase CaiB-like acyl-CoA transferase
MQLRFESEGGREVRAAGNPIRFAGETLPPSRPPVPSGADTDAVLRALLGYDAARIAALRGAGAAA